MDMVYNLKRKSLARSGISCII